MNLVTNNLVTRCICLYIAYVVAQHITNQYCEHRQIPALSKNHPAGTLGTGPGINLLVPKVCNLVILFMTILTS